MARFQQGPSYSPIFGTGAPGLHVPHTSLYFDISDSYAKYIYHAGAWNKSGPVSNIDASSIQGVSVDPTVPTAGQNLTFNGTDWIPQ